MARPVASKQKGIYSSTLIRKPNLAIIQRVGPELNGSHHMKGLIKLKQKLMSSLLWAILYFVRVHGLLKDMN